jgi:transcriptional regulator with XRE-family HTH domain
MIDNEAIGLRIRQEREKLKLSRQELAELVELSEYYIGQIERGERQMSLAVLVSIAKCLHLSLDYIVWGNRLNDTYWQESLTTYEARHQNFEELSVLFNRCNNFEQELILKIVKTILPYLQNNN